ncbi:MAG: hypothetical protein LBH46_00565 [Rickettsiales bacterium]|nr:hypothetical protein [Rickettsiales bacterium]
MKGKIPYAFPSSNGGHHIAKMGYIDLDRLKIEGDRIDRTSFNRAREEYIVNSMGRGVSGKELRTNVQQDGFSCGVHTMEAIYEFVRYGRAAIRNFESLANGKGAIRLGEKDEVRSPKNEISVLSPSPLVPATPRSPLVLPVVKPVVRPTIKPAVDSSVSVLQERKEETIRSEETVNKKNETVELNEGEEVETSAFVLQQLREEKGEITEKREVVKKKSKVTGPNKKEENGVGHEVIKLVTTEKLTHTQRLESVGKGSILELPGVLVSKVSFVYKTKDGCKLCPISSVVNYLIKSGKSVSSFLSPYKASVFKNDEKSLNAYVSLLNSYVAREEKLFREGADRIIEKTNRMLSRTR